MNDTVIVILVAVAAPFVVVAILSPLAFIGGRRIGAASNFASLTVSHLVDFALAKDDRADAIGQYFEWKHIVHIELLKAAVGFLLANASLLIKFAIKPTDEAVRILELATNLNFATVLVVGLVGTITSIGWLLLRIRRIPREYSAAVRLLGLLR